MRLAWLVGLGSWVWCLSASAQAPAEATPATSSFPAEPSAPAEKACVPSCRSGFVCVEGQCVSACNPPCPAGTRCSEGAECISEGSASYQPPAAERDDAPVRVEEPKREQQGPSLGARLHDGFYLRLALGFGYMLSSRELEYTSFYYPTTAPISLGINGFAQVGALMLGGTIADGVVIGGGAWGTNVFAPQVSVDVVPSATSPMGAPYGGGSTRESVETDLLSISLIGPFVAWYPNPRAGWHADLALGYSYAACDDAFLIGDAFIEPWSASGFGAMGAFGHDFWVSEQWSIGVQLRATFMRGSGDASDGTYTSFVPALAMTGTYH